MKSYIELNFLLQVYHLVWKTYFFNWVQKVFKTLIVNQCTFSYLVPLQQELQLVCEATEIYHFYMQKFIIYLWRKWYMLFLLELTALFQNQEGNFKRWCTGRDHSALCGGLIDSFFTITITAASFHHLKFECLDSALCTCANGLAFNVT